MDNEVEALLTQVSDWTETPLNDALFQKCSPGRSRVAESCNRRHSESEATQSLSDHIIQESTAQSNGSQMGGASVNDVGSEKNLKFGSDENNTSSFDLQS